MDKIHPHQNQPKSSSEPTEGSGDVNDALHQLVRLLANHAARDWYSKPTLSASGKEPSHEQSTPRTTSNH